MSTKQSYLPEVMAAHAFREISLDFTTPAEIFREAIANALDAYATRLWLRVGVQPQRGRETVVIDLADNGIGMSESGVHAFLNLSDSQKAKAAPPERVARRISGYKGHGTKIYFNSEGLEVLTYDGVASPVKCTVKDARGELAEKRVPTAEIELISLEELQRQRTTWGFADMGLVHGTIIRVSGYHGNSKNGLEHEFLRDYIRWFTRWGSWEAKLCEVTGKTRQEVDDLRACQLFLRALGKEPDPDTDERIPFGHVFPAGDCTDMKALRTKDSADPLKFYVRTWAFADEPLLRNPDKRIDFLFALEGEGARREYNSMLRRQGMRRRPGDYVSEERYGLWVGRDFVPIDRYNKWVAERSEYTRMHAFVNAQGLQLTANRGSIENTDKDLLDDIRDTVRKLFEERIEKDADYERFEDELLTVERHRHAKKEGEDYRRRLKKLESKDSVTIDGIEFYSPTSETDLIALVAGVQARLPDILPFAVREYDSHFGFDGLAARSKELAIDEAQHLFVEFKQELRREFNHSFERLEAIVCWIAKVKDQEEVIDLAGNRAEYRVSVDSEGRRKRYIVRSGSSRNIEVIVFRELLEARGYKFGA